MSEKKLYQTPSQTVGPYFAYGLTPEQYLYNFPSIDDNNMLIDDNVDGERITIFGQVKDGKGDLIPDAMIELWQADASGKYLADRKRFHGFGRFGTGTEKGNVFRFTTIKPGAVNGQAPHINVMVFMRGLLTHAYTRLYFSDEQDANANDEVLGQVDVARRPTLIAQKTTLANGSTGYEFNIFMQGEKETVFFDV